MTTGHIGHTPLSAENLLAAIVESSDDAIISKSVDGIVTSWNKSAELLFGFTAAEAIGQPITLIIPPDRLHEEDTILAHIRSGERIEHYETVRRRKDGTLLDISLTISPVRSRDGVIVGASKIARDISERKRMRDRQELLLREMNHRVKNLFSVMNSLISLSERTAVTVHALAADLRARIGALAAAHSLILREADTPSGNESSTSLSSLIEVIFAAHQDSDRKRITFHGDDASLEISSLTSFALLLHEFATNAIKYGALSTDRGRIEIEVSNGNELALKWTEIDGPPVSEPIGSNGFGSQLERLTVEALRGTLTRRWNPEGLCIELKIPR